MMLPYCDLCNTVASVFEQQHKIAFEFSKPAPPFCDFTNSMEDVEELDNKKDYDIKYDKILGVVPISSSVDSPDDIEMVVVESFVSTQGWESETVIDYRINEEEFHKIRLFHCDFFIRNPPDPDDNVYDFREASSLLSLYVYSNLKVLATMPQKYIRCAKSNFGSYNVTEPPIDAPRDPLYKTEREIMKIAEISHTVQDARRRSLHTADNPTSAEYDPSRGSEVRPELLTIGIMTPRYSKIEFLTYSGEGDLLSWVKKCRARRVRDDLEAVQRPLSYPLWPAPKQQPFGRASKSEVDMLWLVENLRIDIELQKPENLGIAMNMAMALERKQCFHQGGGLLHTNWCGTTTKLNTSNGGPPLAKTRTPDISKEIPPVSFFKRLTRAEMAERRANGLCFNCDESYSTGHKCKCLFWIEVSDDDKEGEEEGEVNSEISLHAISGVIPRFRA
ncbi:hypothetical protein ZIOFF_052359 [Zingiber officinale]|uniref:Uncharacterized protein n=1 Tax=Zingiber officinale TaxID=94328 RepID=A0A8J5KTZ6_ZINOF|nr:hypothetical protein ZIOFF_052359 [Zingiber officinale]